VRSPEPEHEGLVTLESLAAAALTGKPAGEVPWSVGEGSFIRLGGDSLQANALAAMARDQLGVRLDVRALLSDAPLRAVLAQAVPAVSGRPHRAASQLPPHDPRSADAVSSTQRGIWLREQIVGALPYNLVFTCFVDGPLDASLLTTALHQTEARQEGLRTSFTETHGKLERRVLAASYRPRLQGYSYRDDGTGFTAHVRAMAAELGRAPFDLSAAPPLRFALVRGSPAQHAIIMAAHHIILDGWAVGIVLRELFAQYDALAQGSDLDWPPATQPGEHLRLLEQLRRSGELDRQLDFWRRQLAGVPTVLDLPADQVRPPFQQPHGARRPFDLGPALSTAMRARARQLGVTPAAFLLAASALTLSRYTGARAMLIGMPVAGRPTPELAGLVATTANLVPVRVDIDESLPAGTFLTRTQASLASSLDNCALPFAELVAVAGVSGTVDRHPLVQVALGVNSGLVPPRLSTERLDVRVEEGHGGGAQFDLELFIRQDDPSFSGDLEYATSVWREPEAASYCADLTTAVQGLAGRA
jgi:hypothetical protein